MLIHSEMTKDVRRTGNSLHIETYLSYSYIWENDTKHIVVIYCVRSGIPNYIKCVSWVSHPWYKWSNKKKDLPVSGVRPMGFIRLGHRTGDHWVVESCVSWHQRLTNSRRFSPPSLDTDFTQTCAHSLVTIESCSLIKPDDFSKLIVTRICS